MSIVGARVAVGVCLFLLLSICGPGEARAQANEVLLSVSSQVPPRLVVEGRQSSARTAWSFRNSYAGILRLGERIEDLTLADERGVEVAVRKLAPGEYEAVQAATRFRYNVKLDPPNAATDAAHVSWLSDEHGVLMLGDLLPSPRSAEFSVRLNLPSGWSAISADGEAVKVGPKLINVEPAVFLIGRNLRLRREQAAGVDFILAATGEWAFTDKEAAAVAKDLLAEHRRITGIVPYGHVLVLLAPFPRFVESTAWSAETRDGTVILLSGYVPSKSAGLAQLSVPLAHELFHLWVPHRLSLDGDYQWFYEGFTLYQAMRAGMRLGHLTFQDYLNALGRAFDGYRTADGLDEVSLLESSRRRWTGGGELVYNKGMLVAFLYDLQLRHFTKNKRSLDDVYRELFRRENRKGGKRDGNRTVAEVLGEMSGMSQFARRYIENPVPIDLATAIAPFGLQAEQIGTRTRISVAASLNREQRDMLREFGFIDKNGVAVQRTNR